MAKKVFTAKQLPFGVAEETEGQPASRLPPAVTTIRFPPNKSNLRAFDFTPWYGKQCDRVVWAYQHTIELMIAEAVKTSEQTLSLPSIISYCGTGIRWFLPFCATYAAGLKRELQLSDIDREAVQLYVSELRQSGLAETGQKIAYSHTKSVLRSLSQRNQLGQDIFPRNPFPNINRKYKGERPFSKNERATVLNKIKKDVHAMILNGEPLSGYELAICVMAIAARTGLNPSPLRELPVDCLQQHPLKKERQLLVSYKRRGRNTHVQSLRKSGDIALMKTVLPDVSQIIDLVLSRNASLRAASSYPQMLFVHEHAQKPPGTYLLLSSANLEKQIALWIERSNLQDEDGKPLRVNVSRLRKTFENRIWALSGQDPFLTAKMAGHSVKVSNDHYLEAPPEAEKNWKLMGEVRTEGLRKDATASNSEDNTPIARCKDTKMGDFAPKDGSHCQKFLACFRCRSFVVTGDDLHRLFSFYWMLIHERAKIGGHRWQKLYAHIIRIIDQDIAPRFPPHDVRDARSRAKDAPHPFWRSAEILEGQS